MMNILLAGVGGQGTVLASKLLAQAAMEQTAAANTANTGKEKIPWYCIAFVLTYLIGCIFWNAWFLNYSDYVINEAQIGGAAVSGMIGSLSCLG